MQNDRSVFPLGAVLFVVFVTLKLCDVIHWSWWWVTAPMWIPLSIAAVFGVLAVFLVWLGSR